MSMQPLASMRRLPREKLAEILLGNSVSKIAVVDVRGADHVGGHIHGSTHVPSTDLDHRIPEIVRKFADKDMVVFHCALSQERGPKAARRYMEERERRSKSGTSENSVEPPVADGDAASTLPDQVKEQAIYVLDKGFVGWQEK